MGRGLGQGMKQANQKVCQQQACLATEFVQEIRGDERCCAEGNDYGEYVPGMDV